MKKLLVLVVLLAGCGYAGSQGYDWVNSQVYAPASSRSHAVTFHVAEGEQPDAIAADLKSRGLIKNTEVFLWYLRYSGARSHLQAGDFLLNTDMSMAQIVDRLQNATPSVISFRVPEGYALRQIAAEVQQKGLGSAADYAAAASDPGWQYLFLQSRPPTAKTLEGFLFPDTYQLPLKSTPRDLVKRQLDRFAQVFTAAAQAQAAQATAARPAETVWNVVILASIVEKEVQKDPDRAIVCGIFYNRLAAGIPLGADATVLYALGRYSGALTAAELQVDSPYNTRKFAGLPPGPISNPGQASLDACLNPQKTDYLYYFTDKTGVDHYARNQAEFDAQIRQFGVSGQ